MNKRSLIRATRLVLLMLFVVAVGAIITPPGSSAAPFAALLQQVSSPDSVSTFAANCTTGSSSFNLGDTVCVKASGPLDAARVLRRVQLVNPAGYVVSSVDLTSSPQAISFNLPSNATDTLSVFDPFFPSGITIDNRGTWLIVLTDTSDASMRASAPVTVHDPASAVADLQISKFITGNSQATAGSTIQSVVWVFNYGPDTAQNVSVSDVTPSNTTFQSLTQTTGPSFKCTTPAVNTVGTSVCQPDNTTKSLAKDEAAGFIVTYKVNSSIADNTDLNSTATASTNTTERATSVNTASESITASNPTPPSCTISCPDNITAAADTVENGVNGTHVTFPNITASGTSCETTVTTNIASGSFFPVGSTVVTVTSGDGSCSFIVSVGAPVTISCPAPITANAGSDCTAHNLNVGTPTTGGSNVTVTSSRSDGLPVTDPYPAGVTTITWVATAHSSSPATDTNTTGSISCTQTVTVNDVTPPTIVVAPQTASADASCQAAVPDFTASATITDNCSDPTSITVSQSPAPGTIVGLGPHTITLTANDGSSNDTNNGVGNISTATTTFTVNDTTPPTFTFVPSSVTANTGPGATTCDAVVNVGTATASDNCGPVTITRSPSGNTFPVGTTTITWTATDGANNTTTATQTVTVVDDTPPVITPPANVTAYLPLHSTATSMAVSYPNPATATDNCAGPVTISYSPASGSTFPVGTTRVTVTATDAHNNSATATFTVTVLYDFTGFFSPVNNLPTLNVVNAGRAIPVKFSLSGNKGLSIFAVDSPQSGVIPCDGSAPAADLTDTVTAGSSSLSYDAGSDQYNYVWKTDSSWVGTCRQLVLTLNDGSPHVANFKFK